MKLISSIGLSTKDETVLKALVDLLGARTHENWAYSAPDKADVLILDGDNASAVGFWKGSSPGRNASTIVYSSSKTTIPVTVRRHLTKPLRAADLIAHLNTIDEIESQEPVAASASETSARTNDDFIPGANLLQTVFDTKSGYLTVSFNDSVLTLNRGERSCVMTGTAEQVVDSLNASQGKLAVSFSQHKPEQLSETLVWLGDRSILWQLSLCMSHGKLLQPLGENDALRLTRWPPSSLLKNSPVLMNLCALLSRRSGASFHEAGQQLGLSDSHLAGFLNAAAVCGMLVHSSDQPVMSNRPSANSIEEQPAKGLFARLRSRLGI